MIGLIDNFAAYIAAGIMTFFVGALSYLKVKYNHEKKKRHEAEEKYLANVARLNSRIKQERALKRAEKIAKKKKREHVIKNIGNRNYFSNTDKLL